MTDRHGRYKYTGDEIGTDLKQADYEVVTDGIDNVVLQVAWSTETVEVTKEEFDSHLESGALEEIDY